MSHGVFTLLMYVDVKFMNYFQEALSVLTHYIFTTDVQLNVTDIS